VPETVRSSGMAFVRWLSEHKINSAYLPSFAVKDLYNWLLQEQEKSDLCRLLVGVEPLPESVLVAISTLVPDLKIINGYGPTEATICATLYSVEAKSVPNAKAPIGKPVQNFNIYLLNTDLELVAVGELGELYIGGIGLARGYLNRPDLTAQKFISNPFSNESGDRLYKTGDLAYYLPDGNIQFFGRVDRQVKISGFRIELGEIEAALLQHPAIREVAVLVREDIPDDKRIVAYLVPAQKLVATIIELRCFLQDKLPEYMIPSIFVVLDTLPRSSNDKIEYNALPKPTEDIRPKLGEEYVQPSKELESSVVSIWQEVLQLEKVGISENFFDLGGTSLMIQVVQTKLQEKLHRYIPTVALFEYSTVQKLVIYLCNEDFNISSLQHRVQQKISHRIRSHLQRE
jgi:acyl-coenzyme A synthetase/AMP-(fatty) acid ligase/acyl carrier protein